MKEKEFIELLNLYLDHEISAEDAVRLESEVQRDAGRRQVYHEYCRLHKGCTLLAADTPMQVPTVVEFEPQRRGWIPAAYASVGLMAAACAAFVFFNRSPEIVTDGPSMAQTPAPTALVQPVAAPAQEAVRNIPRTVTVLARQDVEAVQDLRLTWMEQMQLSSLPQTSVESLRFETKSTLKTNPQNFGPSLQEPGEQSAWQFQR